MKLMIVDDSNLMRSRIERVYQHDNAMQIVAKASNGRDALKKATQLQPDLVTMGLRMSGMNGLQCIKHMNKLNRGIKILVVSTLSDVSIALEAIESGARGFLCEPFTDEELLEAIKKISV